MGDLTLLQNIAIWILPVIFAITVHEVAHGWVAMKLGDRTAQMMGRLTLNPIKHIDPVGTLLVPGILLMAGGFIFGWAKPVPVSWKNLNNPKKDMIWVALAGPMANLIMALFWAGVMKIGSVLLVSSGNESMLALVYMGFAGIQINLILMLLNLLPLPPLDGGRVLVGLLPGPLAWRVSRIEPYGFFILIGLLYFGIISIILSPLIGGFMSIISSLFGLR